MSLGEYFIKQVKKIKCLIETLEKKEEPDD